LLTNWISNAHCVVSGRLFEKKYLNTIRIILRNYNIDIRQRYKYNPRLTLRANDKINGTSRISNRKVFQGLAL